MLQWRETLDQHQQRRDQLEGAEATSVEIASVEGNMGPTSTKRRDQPEGSSFKTASADTLRRSKTSANIHEEEQ